MKQILSLIIVSMLASSLLIIGCKKSESAKKVEDNGLTKEINDLISEDILNEMKSLGMPVNTGGNPPSIEKIYFASPFVLKASNRPSDTPGMTFADYRVKFYDQNNDNLTVKCDYVNASETGSGLGGFIVGDNNNFTVFCEVHSTYSGENAVLTHVISGTLVENGVQNLYFANFMLDNNGNPNGTWIEEGEGRVIYDSDGMSEIIESLKSGKINTTSESKTTATVLD